MSKIKKNIGVINMSTNKKSEKERLKPLKLSDSEQVVEFMKNLEHPLKEEIEEVRRIILSTDPIITEHIKWNAPSYRVAGEDRITFNLHGKGFFRLIFHCGAKVKEDSSKEPLFEDISGLLEWVTDDRAIVKFFNRDDIKAKEEQLREVISKWLEVTVI